MTQSSRPGGDNRRPRSSHAPRTGSGRRTGGRSGSEQSARRPASGRTGSAGARSRAARAGSSSRARSAGSRRPSPAAQAALSPGMPKWMLALIIAVPAAGIVGVVSWSQVRSGPEAVVVDPNQEIDALEGRIKGFQTEFRAVAKLIHDEQRDEASSRGRRLGDRLSRWLDDWELVMASHRNEDGELPLELEGYEAVPVPVLRIRSDLMRITGF